MMQYVDVATARDHPMRHRDTLKSIPGHGLGQRTRTKKPRMTAARSRVCQLLLVQPLLTGAAATTSIFDFVNEHIFVHAKLNGQPGIWLLDTGSNLSVISPRAAALSACPAVTARAQQDPYGITRFVSAKKIELANVGAPLDVIGILPRLADKVLRNDGIFITGILGFDWLSRFVVQIDYRHNSIALLPPRSPALPRKSAKVIPLEVLGGVPVVPVSVNGGPAHRCLIDTGANLVNIRWGMAISSGIHRNDPGLKAGPRVAGLTATEMTQAIVLKQLALGSVIFKNLEVSLYDKTAIPWLHGNIGNSLLKSFKVTLDATNRQLVLE
ncbi:MAG: aspartyl protease family protein [Cyanobacteria bacterium NC_groundwater_1444_Ag_S-0.65um_54_12]|nr:aspartyl protease family protein [Cyanobacteria bacterium NC_groundwater_1444_Ag_S-0.65um_54_12]